MNSNDPPSRSSISQHDRAKGGGSSGGINITGMANTTIPHRTSTPGSVSTSDNGGSSRAATPSYVAPSDLLRPRSSRTQPRRMRRTRGPGDVEQFEALRAIRAFLKVRRTYDVLPLSYRLIVLDSSLLVKKSLIILSQNGIVSAPLWDSKTSTFAGLLSASDYLNIIQYYWQNQDALAEIDQFRLDSLREIEKAIGVTPIETVSIHPLKPLYQACRKMLETRARRIPLIDIDDETQRQMVVSVITQYRILKFIAINVKETLWLRKPLRDLDIGTFTNVASFKMDTPVMETVHVMVRKNISSVPVVNDEGVVINVFEAVDVVTLIKSGTYDDLSLTVGEALLRRSDDFAGIYTCTVDDRLDTIFDTIRKSRVHRFIVINEDGTLRGILTLSDILDYILLEGLDDDD